MTDRVGLGFRRELMAGIAAHADRIDVLEVLADDALTASRAGLRALRTLGRRIPLVVHGTTLGLASSEPADERRLLRVARVVGELEPQSWSEHLAFVRAGGVEIGHLAAPPRNDATVEGAARNLRRAAAVAGALPLVENVATLVDPPGSDRGEPAWIAAVLEASGARLLLDLHNLHANATNFGWDPLDLLASVPADRIGAVHLAGGRLVGSRILDDHLHDVPDAVFALLEETASRVPQPLTVIIERDGEYPPMERLLGEMERARKALRRGRMRAARTGPIAGQGQGQGQGQGDLEPLLARLYTDAALRASFLRDPAGFGVHERIDRQGLILAACSFEKKRAGRKH